MLKLCCLFALVLLGPFSFVQAAVTQIQIISKSEVLQGKPFGETGSYQSIVARVHFAVDPNASVNRTIADIALAPRNSHGLVEFSADLYMLKPRNSSAGNGTALVEISNRGGKSLTSEFNFAHGSFDPASVSAVGDGFLMKEGFTLVWIGWEFDVPQQANLLRLYAPVATNHGKPITGLVRSEWIGEKLTDTIPLGDLHQTGYPVADEKSPQNKLYIRDAVLSPRTVIPRAQWHFNDSTHVSLKGGFQPGRIYEVVYLAKNPIVAGLGMAAVRDFVSLLKHGGPNNLLPNDITLVERTLGFGVSQSGRFLRQYLYDGFNQDEQHRRVFDGVWAHVAGAGRGSFNRRFAQPSRDGHSFRNVFYPVDMPPFDPEGLLAKEREHDITPKLFLSNGSYEYWGRAASLIHTTPDGKRDLPPPSNTRIYFFSGSQHFAGSIPPIPAATQNRTNINDYRYGLRALLLAMHRWLKEGTPPPASCFPLLQKHQLVTLEKLHFPAIPGVSLPAHKREAYQLDFSVEPRKVGPAYPSYVPQVDADGNDLGGISMPEVAVPLATNTGWNLRAPSIGTPSEMLSFYGSWLPFSLTSQERKKRSDPRLSIADRYASENKYLSEIDRASDELARHDYLIRSDFPLLRERAQKEWNFRQTLK